MIQLYPIQNAGLYSGIVIFQDRTLSINGAPDVTINGGPNNDLNVVGAVYVPSGEVSVTGQGNLGTVQVIADTFNVAGGGDLTVGYSPGDFPQLHAVGLVE